jgi:hypothetical protein
MSPMAKDVIRRHALKLHADPTRATMDDVRKLVAAVLMLVDGTLPKAVKRRA